LHAEVERLRETARERGNRVIRKDKAIDALKDRNNGLKELIRTHRAEVERAEASVSVYMSERNQARDQIIAYRAEVERLRAVISNAAHKLEQQRVWGGMDWVYPAMHPRVWRAVLEQLDAALKETK
jgi:chromosome segregation ATPase